MTGTTLTHPAVEPFLALHDRLLDGRDEPAWQSDVRSAAIARLQEIGFPTKKLEAWKYTPLKQILDDSWELPPAKAPELAADRIQRFVDWEDGQAIRIVFIDGVFCPALSQLEELPEGVRVAARSELMRTEPGLLEEVEGRHVEHEEDGFKALNAAFSTDGAFVHVPRNLKVEQPIHLLFVGSGQSGVMANQRNLIDVEDGASATVVERYVGAGGGHRYFNNTSTEVFVGENAELEHDKIQRECQRSFHLGAMYVHIDRDGRFSSTAICVGARIGRHEVHQEQGGPNTNCSLNGLYIVDGDRVSDNVVVVNHTKDHGTSEQLYKGILDDSSLGIFNGTIVAEEGTKGTDAHQTNKNLVLADGATAETRPQLEIYADDIACSHGATVGQLDEDSVFYLRSRGIDERMARAMLTHGFASDLIDRVGIPATRKRIEEWLAKRVSWGSVAVKEEDA